MNTSVITGRIPARPASDGAGVKIRRITPTAGYSQFDPFLMLDEIRSDDSSDYAAGFPSHPHRGFETVTYMRQGILEHQDHMGNVGVIQSGGAQWMTAGKGVIHSEMPLQKEGAFHGFQLWLNLPAAEKMRPAEYHDLTPDTIPRVIVGSHVVAVLGGRFHLNDDVVTGPIGDRKTDPHLWDIELNGDAPLQLQLDNGLQPLLFLYEGEADVNGEQLLPSALNQLRPDTALQLTTKGRARLLLLAGKPLREPVVAYGPFVMNTREQIERAIQDYQLGTLTH
jgi:quercetin 2,3-dioxygenase